MQAEGDIDPRLRETPSQQPPQSYSVIGPSNYSLNPNPIRLPPPQAHHTPLHPWPQDSNQSYYTPRLEQPTHHLPPPDILSHQDVGLQSQQCEQASSESKRPRACEACRGLKVRCEPDAIKGTCRRCAKAGRQCIVTAPSRKRQKKTDSRVAELEKKIDALTASLHATKAQAMSESEDESPEEQDLEYKSPRKNYNMTDYKVQDGHHDIEATHMSSQHLSDLHHERGDGTTSSFPLKNNARKRRLSQLNNAEVSPSTENVGTIPLSTEQRTRLTSTAAPSTPMLKTENFRAMPPTQFNQISSPIHEYADVVDRKILDSTTASKIFNRYIAEMACHMPIVVFPSDIAAGSVRKTKPTLFLAILSVASAQNYPDLQRVLSKEIMRAFADRIVYKGEKSLELIQALQVSTIWYWPDDNRDIQFYQMIHMAAVMAIDLDLGKRTKGLRESYHALWKDHPRAKSMAHVSDDVDGRRAWLGCYLLCANASMSLRRSNLIRWSSYMDECLEALESSSDSLRTDRTLCQWIRLQRLADDVGAQISIDDSSSIGITDLKVQYALKGFERQMKDWEKQKPKHISSLLLTLSFHAVNLYMHEFAMHLDQGLESKPGRTKNPSQNPSTAPAEILTSAHIGALTTCLTSIHGLFDTFLELTTADIRTMPVFYFARVTHATVLLIKMYFAAASSGSELGKVISSDDMRVDHYLSRIRALLQAGTAEGKCQPARSFQMVIIMLQTWFERQREGKDNCSDEVAHCRRIEAQPVDITQHGPKQQYKKMQLKGDRPAPRKSSVSQTAPQAPAETTAIHQTGLHLLGDVALHDSGANGHQLHAGSEWNGFHEDQVGSAAYGGNYYQPPMSGVQGGGYDPGMNGGFGVAMDMTFNEGNLHLMDDYGLYSLIQAPHMFGNMV
ncbi:MAG: hypothetical protein Q9167_000210 [Letrouitia subvulpina]